MMEWSPEMHRDLQHFKEDATIEVRDDYSLIALQRPGTVDTLGKRNVCVGEVVGPGIYEGLCTNITCNATLKRVDVVLNQWVTLVRMGWIRVVDFYVMWSNALDHYYDTILFPKLD